MQRFTTRLALAALVALALSTPRLAAAGGYTITDLGTRPGYVNSWTWQQSINNDGVVAAYANNANPPDPNAFAGDISFLWKNGTITPLPGLSGATDTIAFSLSNNVQVVGRSTPTGKFSHAVLWDHGVIKNLGELPGQPGHGHNSSAALNINDRGQAVGYSRNTVDFPGTRQAVLWYKGKIALLPALPNGGNFDEGLGINEVGQIVGFSGPTAGSEHPALWDKGAVIDLGGGTRTGDAYAINNNGQVVGQATFPAGLHPFFWEHGVLTDLGVHAGDVSGVALSINESGQVVGYSSSTNTSHALLWEKGVMIDLQTRISGNSGWTLLHADGINSRGQIDGFGTHNGNYRAFLLTPVP